jgi:hypothetical protein
MLWPLVLPLKITLWSLIAVVVVATVIAPRLKCRPTTASKIKMHKHAGGYRAQYSISDSDFHAYLDGLWNQSGNILR